MGIGSSILDFIKPGVWFTQAALPIAGSMFGGPTGAAVGGGISALLAGSGKKNKDGSGGGVGGVLEGMMSNPAFLAALALALSKSGNKNQEANDEFFNQRVAMQKSLLDSSLAEDAQRKPQRDEALSILQRFAGGGSTSGDSVANDMFQGFLDRRRLGFTEPGQTGNLSGIGFKAPSTPATATAPTTPGFIPSPGSQPTQTKPLPVPGGGGGDALEILRGLKTGLGAGDRSAMDPNEILSEFAKRKSVVV